jgi:hypothetical protein
MQTGDWKPETGETVIPLSPSEENSGHQILDTEELSESKKLSPASGLRSPLLLIVEDNPDVFTVS